MLDSDFDMTACKNNSQLDDGFSPTKCILEQAAGDSDKENREIQPNNHQVDTGN